MSARNSGDSHLLPEGTHAFEFRFRLPDSPDLVTSFEGKFGSVRYFVRADLDQPWSFTHRAKKAFTLISPVDINTPQQQAPVSKEAEKAVCCCFLPWKRGQVAMNVSTDRRGYCPGESVALEALFSNGSGRRVRPTAALQQTQTFTAGGKTRRKRTTFAVLVGQSVLAGGDLTWDALPLKVPAVSPTIANCDFIRVEYAVKVPPASLPSDNDLRSMYCMWASIILLLHVPGESSYPRRLRLDLVVAYCDRHRSPPTGRRRRRRHCQTALRRIADVQAAATFRRSRSSVCTARRRARRPLGHPRAALLGVSAAAEGPAEAAAPAATSLRRSSFLPGVPGRRRRRRSGGGRGLLGDVVAVRRHQVEIIHIVVAVVNLQSDY